jgi:hypothetical protein
MAFILDNDEFSGISTCVYRGPQEAALFIWVSLGGQATRLRGGRDQFHVGKPSY